MPEEYGTSKIYLAAAFMAQGARFVRRDASDPDHVILYFTGIDFERAEIEWDNRALQVNAREYAYYIREMKSKIH